MMRIWIRYEGSTGTDVAARGPSIEGAVRPWER